MFKIIKGYLVNTLIPERLHEMIDRSMAKKNANLSKKIKIKVLPELQKMLKESKEVSSELWSIHKL